MFVRNGGVGILVVRVGLDPPFFLMKPAEIKKNVILLDERWPEVSLRKNNDLEREVVF